MFIIGVLVSIMYAHYDTFIYAEDRNLRIDQFEEA